MSVTSEAYNETYYKLANLPHSFGYLAGNICVPALIGFCVFKPFPVALRN